MSYNSYSNNKEYNKPYDTNTYTAYRFNNGESLVDKTCITCSMWKQNLKIGIFPRKDNIDEMAFDMDNGLVVYLNHTKARILAEEIKNFLRDPETYNGCGVPSGQGIITISNGSEFGTTSPVIVIRKLDETGNVVSSFAYECKKDFYYAVRGYNGGKEFVNDYDTYKNLELECLVTMLEEYYKAMTYAIAHSFMDANRYNHDRLQSRLNAIAEKLGVDVSRGNSSKGSNYSSATSFFNNAGKATGSSESYTPATLDDID